MIKNELTKKNLFIKALVLLCFFTVQESYAKNRIVVLNLENNSKGDLNNNDIRFISDEIRGIAKNLSSDRYYIVTEENIMTILPNNTILSDCLGECIVETGRNLGAHLIVSGSIISVNEVLKVSLKLHETKSGELLRYTSSVIEKNENFEEVIKVSFLDLLYELDPYLESRLESIVGKNRKKQLYCLYNIKSCTEEKVIPKIDVKSMLKSLSSKRIDYKPDAEEVHKILSSVNFNSCIKHKSNLYYSFKHYNIYKIIDDKIKVRIIISSNGQVFDAKVLNKKLITKDFERCLEEKIKLKRFPSFSKNSLEFNYTFTLKDKIKKHSSSEISRILEVINFNRNELLECIKNELLVRPNLKFASIKFGWGNRGRIKYSFFKNGSYKGIECVFKTMNNAKSYNKSLNIFEMKSYIDIVFKDIKKLNTKKCRQRKSTVVLINPKEKPEVLNNWKNQSSIKNRIISEYNYRNSYFVFSLKDNLNSTQDQDLVDEKVYVFNDRFNEYVIEDRCEYPINKIILFNRELPKELINISLSDVEIIYPKE